MEIWVDADACPGPIKEVLFRAARRTKLALILVANHPMRVPEDSNIRMMQVPSGFDIADNEIVKRTNEGDLIITSDIPLSSEVIAKGGLILSPRGERLTKENIGQRLNMRDFMDTIRSSGVHTGGPPALSQKDIKAFADQLDRILAKAK